MIAGQSDLYLDVQKNIRLEEGKRMKKVLFAVKNMNVGGVEKSLLSLLNTIDRTEYEVDLLLLEKYGGFMDAIPDWVNVIICKDYAAIKNEVNLPPMQVIKSYFQNGRIGRAAKLLMAYAKTKATKDNSYYYKAVFSTVGRLPKHYDVAVSYTSIISYLTWYVNYHVDADVYVGWIHFEIDKLGFDRSFLSQLHQKMKKIFVVSPSSLEIFVNLFPELKDKCEVRYNIVDENEIMRLSEEKVECIRHQGHFSIVTIGRLTVQKNQIIIPEIVNILMKKGYMVHWYLIGDGGEKTLIEENCRKYSVNEYIHFLGRKTNPYPYLKQSDIYVQPSIYEGYCIALAEARAFGLPCVATDFSGAHEQLDGKENCFVVPARTDEISNAIIKVLDSMGT